MQNGTANQISEPVLVNPVMDTIPETSPEQAKELLGGNGVEGTVDSPPVVDRNLTPIEERTPEERVAETLEKEQLTFEEQMLKLLQEPEKSISEQEPISSKEPETTKITDVNEQAYLNRIQELESKLTAYQEIEKDPYGFAAKHLPSSFENFNPELFVRQKMSDAGWSDFTPNPNEVFVYGTPSWKYVQDQNNFVKEAEGLVTEANKSIKQIDEQANQRFEDAKKTVMNKYKLDETGFNEKIWSQIESMNNGDMVKLLSDAVMAIEKLKTVKSSLNKQADRTELPASPVNVPGAGTDVNDGDMKLLQHLFPDRF